MVLLAFAKFLAPRYSFMNARKPVKPAGLARIRSTWLRICSGVCSASAKAALLSSTSGGAFVSVKATPRSPGSERAAEPALVQTAQRFTQPPLVTPAEAHAPANAEPGADVDGAGPSATTRAAPLTPVRAAPSVPRPSAATSDQLLEEARLLGEAQQHLGAARGARALQILAEYEQCFAGGGLRAEADSARVFALCQSGRRADARKAAERFLRQYPFSPVANRVREACRP